MAGLAATHAAKGPKETANVPSKETGQGAERQTAGPQTGPVTTGGQPARPAEPGDQPAAGVPRTAGPNAAAGNLVNTGPLITADLITHRIRFEDADAAYDLIDTAPETTIKVVLTYDQ